jgi:hypothetical protein
MLPKLPGMAGVFSRFVVGELKSAQGRCKLITAGMSKELVPKINDGGGGMEGVMNRQLDRVEIAMTVTSERHLVGAKILDGETGGIKFHRNIIVTG